MTKPRHCLVCNKPISAQEQEGVTTLTAANKTLTFCSGACFHTAVNRLTSRTPTHANPHRRRHTMSNDFRRQAWTGFATGIIIGLTLTLAVGLAAVILGHLCIINGAGVCSW